VIVRVCVRYRGEYNNEEEEKETHGRRFRWEIAGLGRQETGEDRSLRAVTCVRNCRGPQTSVRNCRGPQTSEPFAAGHALHLTKSRRAVRGDLTATSTRTCPTHRLYPMHISVQSPRGGVVGGGGTPSATAATCSTNTSMQHWPRSAPAPVDAAGALDGAFTQYMSQAQTTEPGGQSPRELVASVDRQRKRCVCVGVCVLCKPIPTTQTTTDHKPTRKRNERERGRERERGGERGGECVCVCRSSAY
jgi:hypothetical protein